jgi:sortase (surface protein transpeptidase)
MSQSKSKRTLGTILMAFGVLLVLGAGVSYAWEQIQADLLQIRLQNLPPARSGVVAMATGSALLRPAKPGAPLASPTPMKGLPLAAQSDQTGAGRHPTTTEAVTPTANLAPASTGAPTTTMVLSPTTALTATGTLPPTLTSTPSPTSAPSPTSTPSPTNTPAAGPTPDSPSAPVHIAIPDLGINTAVQDMSWTEVKTASGIDSEWQIPEYAAGHAVNSANLGERGNVVISGHNNIYGRVFMPISQAWGGKTEVIDQSTQRSHILDGRTIELVAADGRKYSYVITDFLRVHDANVPLSQRLANGKYIQQTNDTRLTLTTCWPPWNNTYRLIVIAVPAS